MSTMTRGALFGAACALCAILAGSAAAQTYPPGTNCQSLLPNLRAVCMSQIRQLNGGMNTNSTIVPSGSATTVPAPGSINSGTTVTPNGTVNPNQVQPNSTVNPNAVMTPNATVNPNQVQPNSSMNPNMANPPATGNQIVVPPPAGTGNAGTGTGTGTMGTSGN